MAFDRGRVEWTNRRNLIRNEAPVEERSALVSECISKTFGGHTMDVRPLGQALGAEILGVDLHAGIDGETAAQIRRVWLDYQVIVFRGQELSGEEQVRATRVFGELQLAYSTIRNGTEVNYIGNFLAPDGKPGARGDGIFPFHQDGVYRERPTRATFLHALAIPSKGGNTAFASTYRAYEGLSAEMKERCEGLSVVHCYYKSGHNGVGEKQMIERYTHPLVVAHSETGRPLLMCDREMSESVVGLSEAESATLLDELCSAMERPENVYEHVWQLYDLVVWDNLATAHARTDFDPAEKRMMQRTTVLGDKPVAYRSPMSAAR
jgi:taurine dioxygenase